MSRLCCHSAGFKKAMLSHASLGSLVLPCHPFSFDAHVYLTVLLSGTTTGMQSFTWCAHVSVRVCANTGESHHHDEKWSGVKGMSEANGCLSKLPFTSFQMQWQRPHSHVLHRQREGEIVRHTSGVVEHTFLSSSFCGHPLSFETLTIRSPSNS